MPSVRQSGRPAIDSDGDVERCIWEALHQQSEKRNGCQHTLGNDGDIYALDRACDGTRSPLPDIFPKFLSSKSCSVHTERTQIQRQIEEPRQDLDVGCVVGGMLQVREMLQKSQRSIEERKYHIPRPKCRCRRVVTSND